MEVVAAVVVVVNVVVALVTMINKLQRYHHYSGLLLAYLPVCQGQDSCMLSAGGHGIMHKIF